MRRNITIDERDSFTKAILRHVRKPADTCGELLKSFKGHQPPVEVADIDKLIKERNRRSRRK